MSFWDEIARDLAHAQQEAARHITPQNINRGLQMARDVLGRAAEQINQHVTPEINYGIRMAQEGINVAAQQIHQHVTPENINHGLQIARDVFNVAAQHINQHVTPENINHGLQMARDGVGAAVQHISQHTTKENFDRAREEVLKAASGPAAQQVADVVKQYPVPVAVTGTIILISALPASIGDLIMCIIAGLMIFTFGCIAAGLIIFIVLGAQAGMGSVADGSSISFAVMQSAAAGGYGLGTLTCNVQAVGAWEELKVGFWLGWKIQPLECSDWDSTVIWLERILIHHNR